MLKAIGSYSDQASTNAALPLFPHLFQRPGEIRSVEDVSSYSDWGVPSFTPKKPLSENAIYGAL